MGASEPGQSPKRCLFCNMLHFFLEERNSGPPSRGGLSHWGKGKGTKSCAGWVQTQCELLCNKADGPPGWWVVKSRGRGRRRRRRKGGNRAPREFERADCMIWTRQSLQVKARAWIWGKAGAVTVTVVSGTHLAHTQDVT